MNSVNFLLTCSELAPILGIVKTVVNIICWGIPIILIVMVMMDLAKIVTTGEADEKLTKAATKKVITRIIYAVIIFLVPTLLNLIFGLVSDAAGGDANYNASWYTCWSDKTQGKTVQN